jgi:GntR family transcriptional repressor for pyruvate dehydrogenase complex
MVAGTLRPGDRLSTEPDLANEFGVSRATIREAIRGLRSQGLLITTRGARGGHFVITPQTEVVAATVGETFGLWFASGDVTVGEVDEAREVVEMACVRLAAERRTDADLDEMRDLIARAAHPDIALVEFFEVNLQFHHAIAKAARNRMLELPMVAVQLVRSKTNSLIRHHKRKPAIQQHRAILAAIAAQDPVEAQAAFARHMQFIIGQRDAAIAPLHRTAAEIALNEIDE